MGHDRAGGLRDRLRRALPEALKARDAVAVTALRSALAAIDNAQAVDPGLAPATGVAHERLAGTVGGLGAGEVERRRLTEAQVEGILRGEVADRRAAAQGYEQAGRGDHAERLRAEADLLGSYLDDGRDGHPLG